MKAYQVIHGLTLVLLLDVAYKSIAGSMRVSAAWTSDMRWMPFLALALWAFLFWKIWKRPRQWSLGVGILFFVMVAVQTHYWQLGRSRPGVDIHTPGYSVASIVLAELPIFAAGVCCLLLRFCYPKEPRKILEENRIPTTP